MVKKIALLFAYLAFFILALTYFAPKANLYYLLEQELKKRDVVISEKNVSDKGFSLQLSDANVFVKSIKSANVKETDVKIFLLYNSIVLRDVTLSSAASSFIPLKIEEIKIVYSILDPLNVKAYGVGEFGEAEASFNVMERRLRLELAPSQKMLKNYSSTMRQVKKLEDGSYVYDKTF